jgi:XRE family transcriptional regulator, fatty acid utilization regulator
MATGISGTRLRDLRESRAMTQIGLARALGVSASYVNQIEHGARPITVPVLLRITETFGVDAGFFADDRLEQLIAELHEVFVDVAADTGRLVSAAEVEKLVAELPAAAEAILELARRRREADESIAAESRSEGRAAQPHEEVRDFFYRRRNHVAELDEAAESLAEEIGIRPGAPWGPLAERLRRHGITVAALPEESDLHTSYDPVRRVLALSPHLRTDQEAFRMAVQLAFVEQEPLIDTIAAEHEDPAVHALARIGLATYFAAALVLPYADFHRTAEAYRYDLHRLAQRHRFGVETIAHRLSTLQRPTMPGVPFSFVRVDRAGNMSKRQSATGFHFSRGGGTCPLWNVYEAFAHPGSVRVQVAAMPDGARYLWVARTVSGGRAHWGAPGKTFAIALGCEVRHAHRLVYAGGLDLDDPAAATPIGAGCRLCPRPGCAQRAFPQTGVELAIAETRSTVAPYPTADAR